MRYGFFRSSLVKMSLVLVVLMVAFGVKIVQAAEGGMGLYIPGSKGYMAGILPPPGAYLQNLTFVYLADASVVPQQRRVDVDLDVRAAAEFALFSFVTKLKILGGNWAFSMALPVAYVQLAGDISPPNQPRIHREKGVFGFADSVFSPFTVGWHKGDFHWTLYTSVYLPTGNYDVSKIVNVGKNRIGFDNGMGFTWLSKRFGTEVSLLAGYTVNVENDETNYRTGDEFHLDYLVAQHFPFGLAVGVTGYVYQQVTGDSGSGAVLGSFKGRVLGLGPVLAYDFKVGDRPYNIQAKYYKEMAAKHRFEGQTFIFGFSLKL